MAAVEADLAGADSGNPQLTRGSVRDDEEAVAALARDGLVSL